MWHRLLPLKVGDVAHVPRMLATSYQMVTFSSHSDSIWCGQPEDTTSVEKPRSHVPDGNSQMVSTNDTVELTWHSINIIVSWITTFKKYVAKLREDPVNSLRVSTNIWPTLGITITCDILSNHWVRSQPFELCTILRGASNPQPLAPHHQFTQPIKGKYFTFFRIHSGSFPELSSKRYWQTIKWRVQRW